MTSLNQKVLLYPSKFSYNFQKFYRFPKGVGLIILSAAFYGLTMVVTKGTLNDLPPFTLLAIQTASSVIFFWTIIFIQRIPVPLTWDTLKVGLFGLLEPGLSYITGMLGLSLTSASNSTLISTTEPIVTIALSWFLLRERISSSLVILGLFACMGVGFVASGDGALVNQGLLSADLLLFLSVFFASLYAIATSRAVGHLAPVVLAAVQQSVSLILFLVLMVGALFLHWEVIEFSAATWSSFGVAIASGAFGYGLAFLFYLSALSYQPASRVSLYLTLIPIFGVISAYFLLGERFSLYQGFGGSLILLAVLGISRLPQHG